MSLKLLARNTSLLALSLGLTHCASRATTPTPEAAPETVTPKVDDSAQTRELVNKLQDKIQDLETRISAMNEKMNVQNGGPSSNVGTTDLPMETIQKPIADTKVIPHGKPARGKSAKNAAIVPNEAGTSEAVDRYREAKILFDSKRYSDAVLEFAEFVKNEPDHTLAPGAQYYVGMSYFQQKEYKLAEEELSRGLVSYPHSNYVPDYLLGLSRTSAALGKGDKEVYFKQKLLSAFPNSPQAKDLNVAEPVKKSTMAEPETIKPPKKVVAQPVEKVESPEKLVAKEDALERASDRVSDRPEAPSPPTPPNSPLAEPKIIGGGSN